MAPSTRKETACFIFLWARGSEEEAPSGQFRIASWSLTQAPWSGVCQPGHPGIRRPSHHCPGFFRFRYTQGGSRGIPRFSGAIPVLWCTRQPTELHKRSVTKASALKPFSTNPARTSDIQAHEIRSHHSAIAWVSQFAAPSCDLSIRCPHSQVAQRLDARSWPFKPWRWIVGGEGCCLRTEQGSRSPALSPQHPEAGTPLEQRRWIARDEKPLDGQPGSREIEAIVAADRIPAPSAGGTARRLPPSPTCARVWTTY
jgi:hypothetical protein